MLSMAQSYVVGIAECLLIELACDECASEEEICLKTQLDLSLAPLFSNGN